MPSDKIFFEATKHSAKCDSDDETKLILIVPMIYKKNVDVLPAGKNLRVTIEVE